MSILSFLFGTKDEKITVLSASDFKEHIQKKNVQLIDVRTPNEFKSGSIKNAKNIDIFNSAFTSKCEALKKDQPVYVYCQSGGRSRSASKKLSSMGFTEIYDLQGGISNYR
ncbi:rhodanese-like domain-containing protein [Aestuariibaculum sp. M13]|uniref:rhodanese-like domain-containing protein n=1 Tax=Aestuariibaculum sp. M13 TaxID=2967132 RepID=UPI002159C5AB|nr:rhodanese-like domain-containing protein [Aestuariibaculum sp. M13]MCR8668658.1 rhodanese-like domain-containing protein [Aestuariibaculum sp. M13]